MLSRKEIAALASDERTAITVFCVPPSTSKAYVGEVLLIPTLPPDVMRSDSPPLVLVPIISGIPPPPLLFFISYVLPSKVWS